VLALGSLAGCGSSTKIDPNLGGDVYLDFSGTLANDTGAVGNPGWWTVIAPDSSSGGIGIATPQPSACADQASGIPLDQYKRSDVNGASSIVFQCEVLFVDHSSNNYGTLPVEYRLVIKPDGSWDATQTGQPPDPCSGEACNDTPGLTPPPSHLSGKATITYQ
jgi:hypothetical protein